MKRIVLVSLVFALAAGAAWSQRKIGPDGKVTASPFDGSAAGTAKTSAPASSSGAKAAGGKALASPFDGVTDNAAKSVLEETVKQRNVLNTKVKRGGSMEESDIDYFDPATLTPQAREIAMDLVYSASSEVEPSRFASSADFASAVAAEYNSGEYYWLILKGTADKGTREKFEIRNVGALKAYIWFHDDEVDAYLFSPYDFEVLGRTAVNNRYDTESYNQWRKAVESNVRTEGFTVYTKGIMVENRMSGYVVGQLGPVIFPKDIGRPRIGSTAGSIKLLQSTVLDYIRAETGWSDEEILNRTAYRLDAIQGSGK